MQASCSWLCSWKKIMTRGKDFRRETADYDDKFLGLRKWIIAMPGWWFGWTVTSTSLNIMVRAEHLSLDWYIIWYLRYGMVFVGMVDKDDGGKKKAKRKRSKEEIDVKNEYVITLYFTISKKNWKIQRLFLWRHTQKRNEWRRKGKKIEETHRPLKPSTHKRHRRTRLPESSKNFLVNDPAS